MHVTIWFLFLPWKMILVEENIICQHSSPSPHFIVHYLLYSLHFTRREVKKYMPLTSNSSSPIRMRPSVAAGPSGLIPTTKMLMRDLSLLPARLSPSPFLSFSSSIMCNSPGRSAYLCLIFSIKIKRKRKWNRAVKFILQRCQHFPNHTVNPLQWMVLFGEWSTWGHS